MIESTNWYAYTSNNPVMFVDPTGENQALVNFRNWAGGHGHSSAFVQDEKGEWVAGDFAARANPPGGGGLLKESFNGKATGGRFFKTETGTTDLKEAIEIVGEKLNPNLALDVVAIEMVTDPSSDADVLAAIDQWDAMYSSEGNNISEGVEPYKLIGNSCIDSSLDILSSGSMGVGKWAFKPNNNTDILANIAEYMDGIEVIIIGGEN